MRYAVLTMVQELSPDAIETILLEEIVARIAYVDRRGRPFIVPITYAYDGRAFYGYSVLGAKIEGMSANPAVCIEVDRVADAADWRAVVAHGIFESLTGDAAVDAVQRISDRLRSAASAAAAPNAAASTYVTRVGGPGIAFRIRVTEKHGRRSASTF